KACKEGIKKNLYHLVNNFNSYVENAPGQIERQKLAEENYELMRSMLFLGEPQGIIEMLTSTQNLFDASLALINYQFEAVNTIEKLKRLLLNEDYNKNEIPKEGRLP